MPPYSQTRRRAKTKLSQADYDNACKTAKRAKASCQSQWNEHVSQMNSSIPQQVFRVADDDADISACSISSSKWASVHASHRRYMVNGLLFCGKCGYWMDRKALKLKEVCPGVPSDTHLPWWKPLVKRALLGLHPNNKATHWPCGAPASQRFPITRLDLL